MLLYLKGKQRSGKDTVADYLVKRYGFTKMGLADKVKELAAHYFGMQEKDRGLLIQIGMKMREIDPNVWVRLAWNQAASYLADGGRVVITDVRFPNEWEFFQSKGGIAVEVYSPWTLRHVRPGYDAEFENDPTEEALAEYETSLVLYNTETLQHLYSQIDDMMMDIGIAPTGEEEPEEEEETSETQE